MAIIGAAFFPHPPIVLPDVGRGQERAASVTIDGMTRLASLVAELKPQVIVIVTPHGPAFSDAIALSQSDGLTGTMAQFGASHVAITKRVDKVLLSAFHVEAVAAGVPVVPLDVPELMKFKLKPELDHGALVPLCFIEKVYTDYEILHVSPGGQPLRRQYQAGQALRLAAEKTDRRVLVLASGDMSHKLTATGPYGFDEAGPLFDGLVTDAFRHGDPAALLAIDPALARKAGECGWKPFAFALGALDGQQLKSELISYEGPFGVGYMTALLTPTGKEAASALPRLNGAEQNRVAASRQSEDAFVRLARETIERVVRTGVNPRWEEAKAFMSELESARMEKRKAGAFVSIHLEGELRGCMGTIIPASAHVGEEIIRNAVTACSEDPRFPAVEDGELYGLEIKVDVLSPFEQITSPGELDPRRYGVIVEKGGRRGLLLPALEGVDTVESQLDIACRKAGFQWKRGDSQIKLYRFTVERHGGEG